MTRHGTVRTKRDRQKEVSLEKRREPKDSRPAGEPIVDLWDIEGVKYPGSPRAGKEEPVAIYVTDVRGNRKCVVLKQYQRFRRSGTGPEVVHLWRPQSAPELWSGSRHHCLTHALRLFQICSATFEGHHRRSDERKLRGNIHPRRLLEECGASTSLANSLLSILTEHDLVRVEQMAGQEEKWFVNMRTRGFGPQLEQYQAHDLPEWVLPEFLTGEPATRRKRGTDMAEAPEAEVQAEHGLLAQVYLAVQELVPANAEIVDGFALFIPKKDLKVLVAQKLGLSEHKAKILLEGLRDLGVYRSKQGGMGKPWRRFLKLDALEALQAADAQAQPARRKASGRPRPEPVPASEPPPTSEEGVTASPEQLNQLFTELSTRLDEYLARVQELEQELADEQQSHQATKGELAQVRAELEASSSRVVFVLPEGLAKHLEKD